MPNWVDNDTESSVAARERMDTTSAWFKPADGTNLLRILPPHKNMRDPNTGKARFFEPVCLHFNVGPGKAVVPCPRRMLGVECPICKFAFELRDQNRTREGNDLLPSWQGYVNVLAIDKSGTPVVNKNGEIEVKIWSASRKTLDKLFAAIENYEQEHELPAQSLNIADPAKGLTVKLVKKGTGFDTDYDVFLTRSVDIMPLVADWDADLRDLTKQSPMQPADRLVALMSGTEDDPYTGSAPKALPAKASYFDDDTVAGEFTEVPEEEGAPADAKARLQDMMKKKKEKAGAEA